jgi:saccharopine dehydrogenase (NAD+, L-lysine-forming)
VDHNSWQSAPATVPILGLKELEESTSPLSHDHIYFAHCYKNQSGWREVLSRFAAGGGTLYDLEYLTDDSNRRVAAFGYHAGYAGAATAVLALAAIRQSNTIGKLTPYSNEEEMLEHVRTALGKSAVYTRALVIGALGRCGRGAVDLLRRAGLEE